MLAQLPSYSSFVFMEAMRMNERKLVAVGAGVRCGGQADSGKAGWCFHIWQLNKDAAVKSYDAMTK